MNLPTRMSRVDIERTLKSRAYRIRSILYSALIYQLPLTQSSRFTSVVSKKIARHAVDRNRIKRRTREAVRSVGWSQKPHLVILYPTQGVARLPFEEIVADLQALIKKFP